MRLSWITSAADITVGSLRNPNYAGSAKYLRTTIEKGKITEELPEVPEERCDELLRRAVNAGPSAANVLWPTSSSVPPASVVPESARPASVSSAQHNETHLGNLYGNGQKCARIGGGGGQSSVSSAQVETGNRGERGNGRAGSRQGGGQRDGRSSVGTTPRSTVARSARASAGDMRVAGEAGASRVRSRRTRRPDVQPHSAQRQTAFDS